MYASRTLLATVASAILATSLVQASPNMVPNYEVKLLMDPSVVLGTDFKLKPTVLSTFAMPTTVTKMNVQFLDKSTLEIYNAGWSPRMRKTEDEDDFELTYKWRTQKTLSITRTKSSSDSGYSGMDLPNLSDSRDDMIDEAPDKFDDWVSNNWGTTALASSRLFGPILAKRSIGTWSSLQLYIEVWPIRNAAGTGIEYLVEASFKTNSATTAASKQADLITLLTNKGWFLAQDSLKTSLIMQR